MIFLRIIFLGFSNRILFIYTHTHHFLLLLIQVFNRRSFSNLRKFDNIFIETVLDKIRGGFLLTLKKLQKNDGTRDDLRLMFSVFNIKSGLSYAKSIIFILINNDESYYIKLYIY